MTIDKAIILSAGKGSRLLPLTAERPKCLIDLNGRSLLEWQLDALQGAGIARHRRRHRLRRGDGRRGGGAARRASGPCSTPSTMSPTISARSGWPAPSSTATPCSSTATPWSRRACSSGSSKRGTGPIAVTVDEKESYDADDMKVLRDGDRLLRIGKALEAGRYNAESIGLLAFRGEGPRLFADQVERMMRQPDGTRRWYLRAIDALAQAGADVRTVSISGEEWQEVDFPEDVEAAKALTARWAVIPAKPDLHAPNSRGVSWSRISPACDGQNP